MSSTIQPIILKRGQIRLTGGPIDHKKARRDSSSHLTGVTSTKASEKDKNEHMEDTELSGMDDGYVSSQSETNVVRLNCAPLPGSNFDLEYSIDDNTTVASESAYKYFEIRYQDSYLHGINGTWPHLVLTGIKPDKEIPQSQITVRFPHGRLSSSDQLPSLTQHRDGYLPAPAQQASLSSIFPPQHAREEQAPLYSYHDILHAMTNC